MATPPSDNDTPNPIATADSPFELIATKLESEDTEHPGDKETTPKVITMAIGRDKAKAKSEGEEDEENLVVASEDEEDNDDEVGDDEYVVEAITNHMIDDETGELRFEVKWEGYEKKSDRTWEPEENLQTASKILNDYLEKVGGRDHLFEEWEEKREKAKSAKKRGRPRSDTKGESANGSKRGRKSHPASTSPPASSSKRGSFKPPNGSWEDDVVEIDACEGVNGKITVFLTWKGGHRTQHPASQVYHRCPQKMLKFYESHLVFKRNSPVDEE